MRSRSLLAVAFLITSLAASACTAASAPTFTFEPMPPASVSPSPTSSPSPPSPSPSPSPSASPSPSPSPSPRPSPAASSAGTDTWLLVAVGDSIPNNSPKDCPGCTGFVTKYARRVASDTGHRVSVKNLSEHTGLQTDDLLREIRRDSTRRAALRASDIVIVSIGFNDGPWRRTDDPCDGPVTYNDPSVVVSAAMAGYDEACAKQNAENFRARWQEIFSTIRKLRGSRPGLLFALNRYNDWIGYRPAGFPAAADIERVSPMVIRAWNKVLCDVASKNGFHCVDLSTRFNGPDGTEPSGNLVVDDYTHPSQAGNDAIYGLLVKYGYEPLWP